MQHKPLVIYDLRFTIYDLEEWLASGSRRSGATVKKPTRRVKRGNAPAGRKKMKEVMIFRWGH